jgi:hypothetical protein
MTTTARERLWARSNYEKIQHLMTRSPSGQLMQLFVVSALARYADEMLDAGEPADNPRALVSPVAWYACAQEVRDELGSMGARS